MTIEIQNKASAYQYRQNPYNPRCLDKRLNKHRAKWEHLKSYPSTMAAIEALLEIKRKEANS